jgi:hypothetical protein
VGCIPSIPSTSNIVVSNTNIELIIKQIEGLMTTMTLFIDLNVMDTNEDSDYF